MSSIDCYSQCSSGFGSISDRGNVIYNCSHFIDTSYNNGGSLQRNILFTIISLDNVVKIKVRDVSEYSFHYTGLIDWTAFDRMKGEQSLDITFDEFQPQIVDLLKQTIAKQMLVRLEADDTKCKIIFYEKSRLKSLIFLTIDLRLTNQKELVDEMSSSISQLKDFNKSTTSQLNLSKNQLRETELLLNSALAKNCQIEKQFQEDLEVILQTLLTHLSRTEARITTEITKLTTRHQKLLQDIEAVKKENTKKCDTIGRLVHSVRNYRFEKEENNRIIENLRLEVETLSTGKARIEQNCSDLCERLSAKNEEMDTLEKQMNELKRDIQDATMIIAQKTKTNDEIGKDLLEANRLLVNFNNQCDTLSNESDQLKERLNCKDEIIRSQTAELERISKEYENYRNQYNHEYMNQIQHESFLAKQRAEELEKQNKEIIKLNTLLTRKLSNGESFESRSVNLISPKL